MNCRILFTGICCLLLSACGGPSAIPGGQAKAGTSYPIPVATTPAIDKYIQPIGSRWMNPKRLHVYDGETVGLPEGDYTASKLTDEERRIYLQRFDTLFYSDAFFYGIHHVDSNGCMLLYAYYPEGYGFAVDIVAYDNDFRATGMHNIYFSFGDAGEVIGASSRCLTPYRIRYSQLNSLMEEIYDGDKYLYTASQEETSAGWIQLTASREIVLSDVKGEIVYDTTYAAP